MREPTAVEVRKLVAAQFPEWADLTIRPIARQGWDNRTFRLGDDLSVRLPSAEGYVPAIAKEDRWLPHLAGHLPLPVPAPVATGRPTGEFPFPWSVRRWLPGETVEHGTLDRIHLPADLAAFLQDLQRVPSSDGPAAGRHSSFRGCHPSAYSDDVAEALRQLAADVDSAACRAIWTAAIASVWQQQPVWFHGDIAPGNLLTDGVRLSAVIDFGTCGIGDPACDLVIAWTWFSPEERVVFRDAVALADTTWQRARGWALWKALITLAGRSGPNAQAFQLRALEQVLDDPVI